MAIPQAVPEPKKRRAQSAATLASVVYEQLRADLLRGTLAPGEKLRMESLRERYGVGASPVREALNRLAAEGLVVQIDQRGFRVAPVSIEDLRELTKARLWVTGMALRESIAHGDAAWEERIVLAFHRMMRAVGRSPDSSAAIGPAAEKLHAAFHAALIDACGSRWIADFAAMLFDCARRYQHLSTQWKRRPRDIEAEHRAIMDAVLARDAELAVKLHDAHIARTVEIVADMAGHSDTTSDPASPSRRPK
jgi:GntR family transcriptional regulator, carbon starvation induced regulator